MYVKPCFWQIFTCTLNVEKGRKFRHLGCLEEVVAGNFQTNFTGLNVSATPIGQMGLEMG